jgi:hypothetical protein
MPKVGMSTTAMSGTQCCQGDGPCRRTYADYGTYLKNRLCVGPSDLCTLEHRITHGVIPHGCITQSSGLVSIDCDLEVHAPTHITLNSGGNITETAEDFIELVTGDGACPPHSAGPTKKSDIRLSSAGSIQEYAGETGYIELAAGCPTCEATDITPAPGDIVLKAETSLIGSAGDTGWIELTAGCGVCLDGHMVCEGPSQGNVVIGAKNQLCGYGAESVAIQAGCTACPGAEVTASGMLLSAAGKWAAFGASGVHLQAGCGGCSTEVGPPDGIYLRSENSILAESFADVHIVAGCCTGATGMVDVCGPGGVVITSSSGPVNISGLSGSFAATAGELTLEGQTGVNIAGVSGPVYISGYAVDASMVAVDVSGSSSGHVNVRLPVYARGVPASLVQGYASGGAGGHGYVSLSPSATPLLLTMPQLLTGVVVIDLSSAPATLVLQIPAASDVVGTTGLAAAQPGDAVDFSIIAKGAGPTNAVTASPLSGSGTPVGSPDIIAVGGSVTVASAQFRLCIQATGASPSYNLLRLA